MEQNKELFESKPVSKFNLVFRTTYFSRTKNQRVTYNALLFTTVILLFVFLILSLVMTFSFNMSANYFIKDLENSKLIGYTETDNTKVEGLFGTGGSSEVYNSWANSSIFSGTFDKYSNVVGGALTLGEVLNISTIVTATSILSFISVAFVLFTIIFKKQTLMSYISVGISFILLVTLITLFVVLVNKGSENDNIKNFMDFGNKLKTAASSENFSTEFPTALTNISKFLQSLMG